MHSLDEDFHQNIWYSPKGLISNLCHFPHLVTLSIIFHNQPRDARSTDIVEPLKLTKLTHLHLSGMSDWLFPVSHVIEAPQLVHRSLVLQTSPPGVWYDPSKHDYTRSKSANKDVRFPEPHLRRLCEELRLPDPSDDNLSYTCLHITPICDDRNPGLRLVASGATGVNIPTILDLALDEQNLKHAQYSNADYAEVLDRLLEMIPLNTLHELHLAHPSAYNGLLTDGALQWLPHFRITPHSARFRARIP